MANITLLEQAELSENQSLDQVPGYQQMENQEGGVHSDSTDIGGNDVKLQLQGSYFLWFGSDGRENLSFSGEITDNNTKEPSLPSLNLRT